MSHPLPAGISHTQDPGGRPALRLAGPGGVAVVSFTGAQVLSWRTAAGDVLWTGDKAEYATGKPVRGGVPLVFPWFGDHPHAPKLPAHGFARGLAWRLDRTGPGPEAVLTVDDDASTRALWPHPFRLHLEIGLATDLRLAFEIENTGSTALRCEQALHTYFAVGDVHTCSVHGLEGVPCTEQAAAPDTAWDRHAPLRFRAETDRIFQGTPDRLELRAPALGRVVALTTRGARSAIVWNPWPAKAARLSGLAGDDWTRFVCIESANVREHAVQLAPGQRHRLELELRCRPL